MEEYFRKDDKTLRMAHAAWDSLTRFRREADRAARFVYGDQWSDYVPNACGTHEKEEDVIRAEGNIPLKNNRIAPMVRSVLGNFSQNQTEPVCIARNRADQKVGEMLSETVQYVYQTNHLWELDRRGLESLLISGIVAFRSYFAWDAEKDRTDVWTDLVNYRNLIVRGYNEDPRHNGIDLIGQLHDLPIGELVSMFAKGNPRRAAALIDLYHGNARSGYGETFWDEQFTGDRYEEKDFTHAKDDLMRVIEVWTKESKPRLRCHDLLEGRYFLAEVEDFDAITKENTRREIEQRANGVTRLRLIETEWIVDRFWYYRFLSPWGDVLDEGETPYAHRSHPYTIKAYSFFNGKISAFVADCIDVQKHINRLIMMQDFIMKAAAKGVLVIPEESVTDAMPLDKIAREWKSHRGLILYKSKSPNGTSIAAPSQIVAPTAHSGVFQMLQTQLKMFDDVTGVSSAMQGQKPPSGSAASLYAMQTQNSSTLLVDLMESYRQCREDRDTKNLKLVLQYYTEPRYIGVAGGKMKNRYFQPEEVRNIEFDLSLTESTSTPVYRAIQNDFLMELFRMQAIDVRTLLENSSFAYADNILQSIENKQQEMEEAQAQQAQMQQAQAQQAQMQQAQAQQAQQAQAQEGEGGISPEMINQLDAALNAKQ